MPNSNLFNNESREAAEFIKRKTGVDVQIIAPVLTNHNGGSNDGA
jgi:hypothetical protein